MRFLDLDEGLSDMLGYAFGVSVSLALKRRSRFSRSDAVGLALAKFVATTGLADVANLAAAVVVVVAWLNKYVAPAIGVQVYASVRYRGRRRYAFSKARLAKD